MIIFLLGNSSIWLIIEEFTEKRTSLWKIYRYNSLIEILGKKGKTVHYKAMEGERERERTETDKQAGLVDGYPACSLFLSIVYD